MRLARSKVAATAAAVLLASSTAIVAQSMSASSSMAATMLSSGVSASAASATSASSVDSANSIASSTSSSSASSSASASYVMPSTVLAPTDITGMLPSNFMPPHLLQDNGTNGPQIEIVHYYYDQWPIGLAVVQSGSDSNGSNSGNSSSSTSIFACYVRGDYNYTLGKVANITSEVPWPSADANLPPNALQNMSLSSATGYTMGSDDSTKLISVQALYVDPKGRLWALDTGRPTIMTARGATSSAYATVGGPKLIRYNADNATVARTYTFPGYVHYPDSYMNDVRFDLRSNVTAGGEGVAYIVDSSNEGRNAFIVLDLGTGHSWRRLEQHPSTLHIYNNRPSYFGKPFFTITKGQPEMSNKEGFDGLALSADGSYAYYSPLVSNYLYRVPTSVLLVDNGPNGTEGHEAELKASQAVENLGQKGSQTNGFDSDSNGIIYLLAPELNGILSFDPSTGKTSTFVRDPRLLWIDSAVVADDGYIYGNVNQLPLQAEWNNGTEMRVKPGMIFRAKLPNGGKRITTSLGG